MHVSSSNTGFNIEDLIDVRYYDLILLIQNASTHLGFIWKRVLKLDNSKNHNMQIPKGVLTSCGLHVVYTATLTASPTGKYLPKFKIKLIHVVR